MFAASVGFLLLSLSGSPHAEVELDEYRARRGRLMSQFSDGIVLLHARATASELDQHRFRQNPSFYYFTGLGNQPSAILALDGTKGEARLFVPPAPSAFGGAVDGVSLAPGNDSADASGFDRVQDWDELDGYLRARLAGGVEALYLDEPRRPVPRGNPSAFSPMAGHHALWRRSIEEAFPNANIRSAAVAIREMRWVKSAAEISILRRVARASSEAVLAGMRAVDVGASQRTTEIAVVSGCIAAGAEGPSFWPWTMAGPNAHPGVLTRSFYDYHHLNRTMQAGELMRMDIGCDLEHYEGDVGRTIPVSGGFSKEQREAWDLLIAGYRGGLAAIRDGATRAELAAASRAAVAEASSDLETDYGRRAASTLQETEDSSWHVHGVGIDAGEERLEPLRAGSVIAYEPGFTLDEHAYYLEDMILVTSEGHEVLSIGLPYTASEMEAAMGRRPER